MLFSGRFGGEGGEFLCLVWDYGDFEFSFFLVLNLVCVVGKYFICFSWLFGFGRFTRFELFFGELELRWGLEIL